MPLRRWPALLVLSGCFFSPAPGPDSAAVDTDDTHDTTVPVDTADLVPLTLRAYTAPCLDVDSVGPAPGEEQHHAAARLSPPAGFRVTAARVRLVHRPAAGCAADGAYEVTLFTASGGVPPATPVVAASASFDATVPLGEVRTLTLTPAQPLAVPAGADLYVAFDFAGQTAPVACVEACKTAPHPSGAFWSNAASPPYAWATLDSFGIGADYTVEVDGLAPE